MSYQIRKIIDWWDNFHAKKLLVSTKNTNLCIPILQEALPHLLGLHYVNKETDKYFGMRIRKFCYKLSDEEIYAKVNENHPEKLANVKARIAKFRYFMENLEKARLVERTNQHTVVRSQHFFLEVGENKYMHLGLLSTGSGEIIDDFGIADRKALETFLVDKKDGFSRGSLIIEPIRSIERYDEASDSYVPFSFNEEKNRVLLAEYNARRFNPSVLAEIKEAKAFIKARDKPEANKTQDKGLEL